MTTGVTSTTVVPNELSCKLQTELLDSFVLGVWTKVLVQDEGVGDRDIEKEVVYVFVKLPTLGAAAIVATQLITVINCTHTAIVHYDALWHGTATLHPSL